MIDDISIPPTDIGPRGRYWEIPLDIARKTFGVANPDDSTICCLCVEAPYANMMWHSYMLNIIHLRPLPGEGRKPPVIHLPGATHEILVAALDPETPRRKFIEGKAQSKYLSPINFIGQMILSSDAEAADILHKTARDVVDATLNPDTDYIKWWAKRFGAHCLKPGWDAGSRIMFGGKELHIPAQPVPEDFK